MLNLKLQYFGHLMQRTDSLEKTLMLGKIEGGWRREMRWLDDITDLMDISLSKLRESVMDRAVHGVAKSQTRLSNWTTSTIRNHSRSLLDLFSMLIFSVTDEYLVSATAFYTKNLSLSLTLPMPFALETLKISHTLMCVWVCVCVCVCVRVHISTLNKNLSTRFFITQISYSNPAGIIPMITFALSIFFSLSIFKYLHHSYFISLLHNQEKILLPQSTERYLHI